MTDRLTPRGNPRGQGALARSVAWLAYCVYLGSVGIPRLDPSPGLPRGVIARVLDLAATLGVTLDSSQVEFMLNIVMLVPLSLIGGLLFQRLRVADWTAIGFGASLVIEVVQRLVLPTRFGSSRDVVANTLRPVPGGGVAHARARHPRPAPSHESWRG